MTSDRDNLPLTHALKLRRSVLTVPAINRRALDKVAALDCDAVIFDLEDSVAPEKKAEARANLLDFLEKTDLGHRERIIRVNASGSAFFRDDMDAVLACMPEAVLLPKVEEPEAVQSVAELIDKSGAAEGLRVWAMIETPRGILNAAAIASCGRTAAARLDAFVVGLNDLRKATGVPAAPGRSALVPWLMQVVLAARAYGLDVIDSVSNDFKDLEAFAAECNQGRAMGFDGKMLIHPAQVDGANTAFGPSTGDIAHARLVVAAFARPDSAGLNVINADGRMIERLHLEEAEHLLAKLQNIQDRKVHAT
ncbi:HpcH/HpaI aldolase/citrate lyase family protein [Rhizobium sp. SL42]|uniref:HpcH/HpaI aldolase/citrate lyase family protein n=1 Tax=Rhizobium sp. SL42 TaxID=2806346 RepID=UPI001F2A2B54|nr:CoA ester lyase [Rhizobium sp. SL42]UJW75359.1 CoA ester lyase [Rhizobium sp. SL42]